MKIGWQWKITSYGVECHEQDYSIPWKRLLETTERDKTLYYDWPVHLAEKTWVDVPDFCAVYLTAIQDHRAPNGYSIGMARRSFEHAKKIILQRKANRKDTTRLPKPPPTLRIV